MAFEHMNPLPRLIELILQLEVALSGETMLVCLVAFDKREAWLQHIKKLNSHHHLAGADQSTAVELTSRDMP